jgi:hypothetical protein
LEEISNPLEEVEPIILINAVANEIRGIRVGGVIIVVV